MKLKNWKVSVHSYLALDENGEPLRAFYSKEQALFYIENKKGFTIKFTGVEEVKETLTEYELALKNSEECLI